MQIILAIIWILGVLFIFFTSNKSIDQYKRDFEQLKDKHATENKKLYNEIEKLKEQLEQQKQEIVHLKYHYFIL